MWRRKARKGKRRNKRQSQTRQIKKLALTQQVIPSLGITSRTLDGSWRKRSLSLDRPRHIQVKSLVEDGVRLVSVVRDVVEEEIVGDIDEKDEEITGNDS